MALAITKTKALNAVEREQKIPQEPLMNKPSEMLRSLPRVEERIMMPDGRESTEEKLLQLKLRSLGLILELNPLPRVVRKYLRPKSRKC